MTQIGTRLRGDYGKGYYFKEIDANESGEKRARSAEDGLVSQELLHRKTDAAIKALSRVFRLSCRRDGVM